jgi:hypothetical protein
MRAAPYVGGFDTTGSGADEVATLRLPRRAGSGEDVVMELPAPIRYLLVVAVEGREVPLKRPLMVRVERDGAFVSALSDALGIHGIGSRVEEAMDDLAKEVVALWSEYRTASPRDLHASAIAQALKLRALIGE